MDLKGLVSSKKEVAEKYWSVIIEPDWVQSGIWTVRDGKVDILSSSQPLPWSGEENLTDVVDSSLSVSVGNLSEDDLEISKTVFGLTSFWLSSDGGIKPEYQDLIKNVCQELSLKPVGYVGLNDALAFYLKSREMVPLNAILVGLGEKNLSVSLFVEGTSKGEVAVSRSLSVTDDVVEGLSRFSYNDPFPPRIILYDGREGEVEEVLQELISADWSGIEKVKFLHMPKVEAVGLEEKIEAVSLAGGVEILGATSVLSGEESGKGEAPDLAEEKEERVAEVKDYQERELPRGDNFSSIGKEELGFVIDKDIQDIGEKVIGKQMLHKDGISSDSDLVGSPKVMGEKALFVGKGQHRTIMPLGFLSKLLTGLFGGPNKTLILTGILLLLVVLTVLLAAWWFLPRASVVIYLSPKRIESRQDIMLDTNVESIDLEKRVIPATLTKKEVSGEKTIPTSGTKLTGERAKGKVVIYRTGSELKLNKGTKVQSANGLTFVLDDDVVVASGSASSPTKTEAQVTAADIGSEYNLSAGESFSVANYATSEIEAKNEEAFSGGSSREISSVSPSDYERVFSELKKELLDKAASDIKSALPGDEYLVMETVSEREKQKSYDHKIGDEATNLKLNLTFEVSAFSFKKSDMFELSKDVLKEQITQDYILREGQLSLSFDVKERKEDKALISTSFSANLLPAIDAAGIKNKIAGRNVKFVEDYLIRESGYDKVRIDITPGVFRRFGVLPHLARNIEVQFEASR